MNYKLKIDLDKINDIPKLIEGFRGIYELKNGDYLKITIDIPSCKMVYPEYLAIIAAMIKYLRCRGIEVDPIVNNPSNNKYVSRINFYKELDLDYEEDFIRHNGSGNFIEITNFDGDNSVDIVNDILKIISSHFNLDKTVLNSLNYCFFEVVDNVYNHAASPIDGYVVVQNYPYNSELRIIILDKGIGVHESLTKTPGSSYTHLSPKESIEYCIKKEVTNGKGRGNGLYHTTQFIKSNKGQMMIYSGGHCLNVSRGKSNIIDVPYWQGTIVYVKIKNNNKIDLTEVFGENIPTTVEEADECIYSLW